MKKLFTVLAIALFTISVGAQETKPAKKEATKKETVAKKGTKEEKTCTKEEKAKCAKTSKSCCSKKE
jgi:hypothetical protein